MAMNEWLRPDHIELEALRTARERTADAYLDVLIGVYEEGFGSAVEEIHSRISEMKLPAKAKTEILKFLEGER